MTVMKGRKFVNCFFKKKFYIPAPTSQRIYPPKPKKISRSRVWTNLKLNLRNLQILTLTSSWASCQQELTQNAHQSSSHSSTAHPSKTLPGVRWKQFNFQSWYLRKKYHYWTLLFWPSLKRCQRPDLPHGWKTSYFWQMRPRSQLPAWSVVIVPLFGKFLTINLPLGSFCISSAYMFTQQDLDTKHKRMRAHYPKQDQAQLNQMINSTLIFMVVRWVTQVMDWESIAGTPWTASLLPTLTRSSLEQTIITTGF